MATKKTPGHSAKKRPARKAASAKKAPPTKAKRKAPAKKMTAAKRRTVPKAAARGVKEAPRRALARDLPEDAKGVKVDFGEFFQTVGKGLVAAQRQLDSASREYLDSVSGKPHLLPSVFRIPKLSAQMKFALTKGEKEKFDILFFGKDSSAETLHQQSVEFEVVSAPPPHPGTQLPYGYNPVLSPQRRGEVFDTIRKLPGAAQTYANLLKEPLDQVLIQANQTDRQYLIARADEDGKYGMWYLIAPPEETAVLAVLRRFGAAEGAEAKASEAMHQEGRSQAEFMAKLD